MNNYKTDIYIFSKDGERKKIKDCVVLNNFLYHRIDFFLLEKGNIYEFCVNDDKNDLIAIWSYPKEKDGITVSSNEVAGLFRKGFDKNQITRELIDKFLINPKKHTLLKIKKKRR